MRLLDNLLHNTELDSLHVNCCFSEHQSAGVEAFSELVKSHVGLRDLYMARTEQRFMGTSVSLVVRVVGKNT